MYWRYWKKTDFFFLFCFKVIQDVTSKWRFQRTMTCHYLTEMGIKIFERLSDLYLNSKVAPDTCNATGLWLSLEPESKIVPIIYSHGDDNFRENCPHFMVILCESYIKQNRTKRTTNAIAKYFFTRGAKTVISNIKLPFTVDIFLYTCRDPVMTGNAQGKWSPSVYLYNMKVTVP